MGLQGLIHGVAEKCREFSEVQGFEEEAKWRNVPDREHLDALYAKRRIESREGAIARMNLEADLNLKAQMKELIANRIYKIDYLYGPAK